MSFCLQIRFLFSSNEHAQSTTLGPKLMFSKVSRHFVDAPDPLQKLVSACIWLSVVFFQNSRTLDILHERFQCTPLGPKLTLWVFAHHFGALKCPFGFAPHTLCLKLVFQVVSRHFVAAPDPLWKSVSGALNAQVYASKTISCYVATNMPNPVFQS